MRASVMILGVSAMLSSPAIACELDGMNHRFISFAPLPSPQATPAPAPAATTQASTSAPRKDDSGFSPLKHRTNSARQAAPVRRSDATTGEGDRSRSSRSADRDTSEGSDRYDPTGRPADRTTR